MSIAAKLGTVLGTVVGLAVKLTWDILTDLTIMVNRMFFYFLAAFAGTLGVGMGYVAIKMYAAWLSK